jgi:hypothetical protein
MENHKQFIPAQPGWLALFEDTTSDQVEIHAEPVVAWCMAADEEASGHHVVSFGRAVIGAGPWIDKAESEKTARFFALVREDQLDAELLEELRTKAHHSTESLMERALKNHEERKQGHISWVHERRSHRSDRPRVPPTKIF